MTRYRHLLTIELLARRYAVTPGRIRQLRTARSRRRGAEIGRRAGQTWVFTEAEAELLRPRSGIKRE